VGFSQDKTILLLQKGTFGSSPSYWPPPASLFPNEPDLENKQNEKNEPSHQDDVARDDGNDVARVSLDLCPGEFQPGAHARTAQAVFFLFPLGPSDKAWLHVSRCPITEELLPLVHVANDLARKLRRVRVFFRRSSMDPSNFIGCNHRQLAIMMMWAKRRMT